MFYISDIHLLLCYYVPGKTDFFPFSVCVYSTDAGDSPVGTTTATNLEQPQVIPSQGDLLGDLLNLDLGPPVNVPQVSSMQVGAVDLLGGGLDSLVSIFLPSFFWLFLILDMLKNFTLFSFLELDVSVLSKAMSFDKGQNYLSSED